MKKTLLGSLVGGVILFIWSFLAWVILPLHNSTMHAVTNEDAVANMIAQNAQQKSVYTIPHNPATSDKAAMDAWAERLKRGPNAMIIFDPAGTDPMMPSQMLIGLVLDLLSAFFVIWFLTRSTAAGGSYLARVTYCGMIGIFVSVFVHLMNWNWMGMPGDFTSGLVIDTIVGWILAGLGIAAVVNRGKDAAVTPA